MESKNTLTALRAKLKVLLADSNGMREYVKVHYLSIKHHRQCSFDFEVHSGAQSYFSMAIFAEK